MLPKTLISVPNAKTPSQVGYIIQKLGIFRPTSRRARCATALMMMPVTDSIWMVLKLYFRISISVGAIAGTKRVGEVAHPITKNQ